MPDSTKPLLGPMLTYPSVSSSDIHVRAISQEIPQPLISKISVKITYLKFHLNLPVASELTYQGRVNIWPSLVQIMDWR